jgi:hypothetical protein
MRWMLLGALAMTIAQSLAMPGFMDVTGGACNEQCYFESPTGCANQRAPQG